MIALSFAALQVMGMLWKRMLQDARSNWRRTYKSLLLLDYLLKNGSERVVTSAREHVYDLRTLENYSFVDENGEEEGEEEKRNCGHLCVTRLSTVSKARNLTGIKIFAALQTVAVRILWFGTDSRGFEGFRRIQQFG